MPTRENRSETGQPRRRRTQICNALVALTSRRNCTAARAPSPACGRGKKNVSDKTRNSQTASTRFYLSSPARKNIALNPSGKSILELRQPTPSEGRIMIVTNVGWAAVDATVPRDERRSSVRRNRVVLAPRCWRQAWRSYPRSDGGNKAGHREERVISRKATAQGRPGCLRFTCMIACIFFCANRTRDRGCSVHPVFPAPSDFCGCEGCLQSSGWCRENAKVCVFHQPSLRAERSNPWRCDVDRWIASSLSLLAMTADRAV